MLNLTAREYFLTFDNVSGRKCAIFGIAPTSLGTIIGAVMLEKYVTYFDRAHKRVGFVRNTEGCKMPTFQLQMDGGNNQTTMTSTRLPQPLSVRVSASGKPVSGVMLNFDVSKGSGKVLSSLSVTDSDGIARTNFIPSSSGDMVVEATAFLQSNSKVSFVVHATPDPNDHTVVIIVTVFGIVLIVVAVVGVLVIYKRRKQRPDMLPMQMDSVIVN